METDEVEARWHEAWAEHASEAEWSDKVPTSIDSSNQATGDMSELDMVCEARTADPIGPRQRGKPGRSA